MNTTTPLRSHADTRTLPVVTGLLTYAETDVEFAQQLALIVRGKDWALNTSVAYQATQYLTPPCQIAAIEAAQYLLATIHPCTHPHSTALLATWAARRDLPQDIVIGIVGVAIIGPTLGILDKPKKKRRAELTIVLTDKALAVHSKASLATATSRLAQRVITNELRAAGGNAYRLHPDTAEWTFEAGPVVLYRATSDHAQALLHLLQTDNLSHQTEYETDGSVSAIALSPMIDETICTDHGATLVTR